ncbi:membrane fusion protein (multidrug efflux system) [Sphingomonas zeicaulis]|uniref:efflux RND transporter periplasmic adaptor subunit n=1 Tax=Sphingomonas zeicaulis TaxID=1632740 RepID=UPI003D1C84AC
MNHRCLPCSRRVRWRILIAALCLSACSGGGEQQDQRRGAGGPVEVGFVAVQPTSVPITTELAGRVNPFQVSQVRPQVSGVLQRRLFTEGTIVHAGQTLYQIDQRLYRAAADEARANVQSARANADATRLRAERLKPLAEMEAVAAQDYTDAAAAARQAQASVAQTSAQLATANVNLGFTTVPAPITGRIGRSLFTVGALVTANQADPLAVIQQLDPIFVDIQQSSAELVTLRRSLAEGGAAPGSAQVTITLEDGSLYPRPGTVEFTEVMVDPDTGTVTLRARFPNPDGLLLPGMFVRARFAQSVNTRAFLVPQQALARDAKGQATVYVVGPNNVATQRSVTAVQTQGTDWVVTSGLNPGDKVITQGINKLRPNAQIKPVPASAPQRIVPPKGGGAKGGGAKGGGGQAQGG